LFKLEIKANEGKSTMQKSVDSEEIEGRMIGNAPKMGKPLDIYCVLHYNIPIVPAEVVTIGGNHRGKGP
jgi:hypothetical protein